MLNDCDPVARRRFLPVFSTIAGVAYFLFMGLNIAPFAYYPLVGQLTQEFLAAEVAGPPMYWYGWIVYATLAGLLAAVVTFGIPARLGARIGDRMNWVVWIAPFATIIATIYFLWYYFA